MVGSGGPKVVRTNLLNRNRSQLSHRQRASHEDETVDLWRMTPPAPDRDRLDSASLVFDLTMRFNQYFKRVTDERLVLLQRYALLQLHDVVAPGLCFLGAYSVRQRFGFRADFR